MSNLILTDCDGVLLDWERGFEEWMSRKGYMKIPDYDITAYGLHIHYGMPRHEIKELIREFNESASIGFLKPYRAAEIYLPILVDMGYEFTVITSLTSDPHAGEIRKWNLERELGIKFKDVICLDVGADKDEELAKWRGKSKYWIEDKLENAVVGAEMDFKTFLMAHEHNTGTYDGISRVENWADIFDYFVKQLQNQAA